MKMNDMMVISVDDHVSEPPDMFDKHLSGDALASAPKMRTTATGTNYWEYQGMKMPQVGLNAVVGRVPEEYGMEPTSLDQLRKGVYQVDARIDDMNVNGIAASLNFASCVGFDGGVFHKVTDKAKALVHLRAYNDWHIDEWCGAHPGRFIPCALLPTWDQKAMVEEVKRIAAKGCTAVSLNENPDRAEVAEHPQCVLGAAMEGRRRARHRHVPAHRRRQSRTACIDGDADRGLDIDHAHFDRGRCSRLAASRGARALSDHEDRALRGRHRLDSLFPGAQRLQPRAAQGVDPFSASRAPSRAKCSAGISSPASSTTHSVCRTCRPSARIWSPTNAIIRIPIPSGRKRRKRCGIASST